MTIDDKDNRSITFKNSVSLDQFGKALGYFEKMFKIMSGRAAMYTDFTDWLVTQDFVEVGPSMAEIEEMTAKAIKKAAV